MAFIATVYLIYAVPELYSLRGARTAHLAMSGGGVDSRSYGLARLIVPLSASLRCGMYCSHEVSTIICAYFVRTIRRYASLSQHKTV